METATFQFKNNQWSVSRFPELDSPQTLIHIFASPKFINNPEPIDELCKHYPNSKIIGCSTAGEIAGEFIYDNSISVSVTRFKHTTIEITSTEISSAEESFTAGQKIVSALEKNNLKHIFVLSDGLNVNGTALTDGLNSMKMKEVIVTGGLAGDGSEFKRTWVIYQGKILRKTIVAIGLYGDKIKVGHASQGGWSIFGPERVITRSQDNILFELDGKPALALYKEYLGDKISGLPATGLLFPLAIRSTERDSKQLVRTILAIDEKNQSLIFAGNMPNGYLAQLMRANFDRLITASSDAGQLASQHIDNKKNLQGSVLAIAISCVGRRLLLGERTDEETQATLETLPSGTHQLGFYSYGELSPYTQENNCDLHNQTMTMTIYHEE